MWPVVQRRPCNVIPSYWPLISNQWQPHSRSPRQTHYNPLPRPPPPRPPPLYLLLLFPPWIIKYPSARGISYEMWLLRRWWFVSRLYSPSKVSTRVLNCNNVSCPILSTSASIHQYSSCIPLILSSHMHCIPHMHYITYTLRPVAMADPLEFNSIASIPLAYPSPSPLICTASNSTSLLVAYLSPSHMNYITISPIHYTQWQCQTR